MSRTYRNATRRPMRCEGCGVLCADATSYFDHARHCEQMKERAEATGGAFMMSSPTGA